MTAVPFHSEKAFPAMPRDRLPSAMWVSATLRGVNTQGGFGAVINKGERESGSLVLRLNLLDGTSRILTETRDLDGNLGWLPPLGADPIPDEKADAYVTRSIDRDPDIWVVEIETREGKNPFEGKELK